MIKRLLCLIILLFAVNVKALSDGKCETNELKRLKEEASHLSFSYEFKEGEMVDGQISGSFDVIVDNIPSDLKVMVIHSWEMLQYDEFIPNSNGTGKLTEFSSGDKVKITVKAYVNNGCVAKDILVRTINLPYINVHYGRKECKENPNFKFCKEKLTTSNVTEATFKSEYQKYLKEKELANPELVVNNTKIYIVLALIVVVPLAFVIKNYVTKIIEKRKDEI